MASWLQQMIQRKSPQEVLSFFEGELLKEDTISDTLHVLRNAVKKPNVHRLRSRLIILVYLVFAVRSAILFLVPIFAPKNTIIPFVLGDNVAVLGLAFRQMWYSLCVNYSILFAATRLLVEWAENRQYLTFLTDYPPHSPISRDLEKMRGKLNVCLITYRCFNAVIYANVAGTLILALSIEIMEKRSIPHFCFSLFWSLFNGYWIMHGPNFLLPILFFVWLAGREVCEKIQMVHESAQDVMKQFPHLQERHISLLRSKMEHLFDDFEAVSSKVTQYNRVLKYMFLFFRYLFLPLCASDCYVLFAGQFPNLLLQLIILILSLSQLVAMSFFMSLSAYPRKKALPICELLFSIQARMSHYLSPGQRVRLLRMVHKIRNERDPVGYTCGEEFTFEAKSMFELAMEIGVTTILFLQMIPHITPAD